jgi:hypothetical protein
MTDQEGEVELLQDLSWHNGWVTGLGSCIVWIRCFVAVTMTIGEAVGEAVGMAVGVAIRVAISEAVREFLDGSVRFSVYFSIGSYTLFGGSTTKRWCNTGGGSMRWYKVMSDILDQETFSLEEVSSCLREKQRNKVFGNSLRKSADTNVGELAGGSESLWHTSGRGHR